MPRYKEANYAQGQFVSIQFEHQILPGSFEHALSYVVDRKINMSAFDALRKNDAVGAPAYAVEAVQHGEQSLEDLPLRMEDGDGAERTEGDGGVKKTLSTQSTRKDGR